MRNQSVQVQFLKVRINNDDLEEINKNDFAKRFVARKIEEAQSSDSTKKYQHGFESIHQKAYVQDVQTILEN